MDISYSRPESTGHSSDDESTLLDEKDLDEYDNASTVDAFASQVASKRVLPLDSITRSSRSIFLSFLHFLLPSFVRTHWTRERVKPQRLHGTAYLDGLRGLAAFAVFLCHLSYGTFDITHSYGAGGAGQNTSWLRLPVVRLLYSGPPAVSMFFVISGYALSYKPVRQMHNRQHAELLSTLSSSVFRRTLRLYLPCFISAFMSVCLAQLGVFRMTEDFSNHMRNVHEEHFWTAPDFLTQVSQWARKSLLSINVFDWSLFAGGTDLDHHLWTIPVELRCSLALFVTHILVARMSSRARLSTLSLLLVWGVCWDRWDLTPFWAGAMVAELDLRRNVLSSIVLDKLPFDAHFTGKQPVVLWRKAVAITFFVTGLFLASYPDAAGHVSPGYQTLDRLIPSCFGERHRFWPNIGAAMIVWSMGRIDWVKNVFNSRLMQYMGQISFPLYVVHGPMIHTFGYAAFERIYRYTGQEGRLFEYGFAAGAACTILATIWVADIFLRVVDQRCVNFARWVELRVLQ